MGEKEGKLKGWNRGGRGLTGKEGEEERESKGRGTEKEGQRQAVRTADGRRAVFLTWLRLSGLELSHHACLWGH